MKRLLVLPLLALPLLFVSCDRETATEPATPSDASFDVTTLGLTTNTLEFKGWCASGYTGYIRFSTPGTQSVECPGGSFTKSAIGVNSITVDYFNFDPAVPASCTVQRVYSIALGAVPARSKCTVNGFNANGKPIARMSIRYVK